MTTDTIISKVWSFCTTLRDDGVGYGDYLEQLTYLIFLKMADEYGRPPYKRNVGVPKKFAWPALKPLKGAELEVHYVETLRSLGTEKGMLGQIFTKAQNKITDPAKLARLIEIVDGVDWVMLDSDVKGDIYEGILEKNNVLFEGGAGETVRKKLMETTELHTILRLPTGIFYAQGVKANVLFFDNRPASKTAATKEVWYYDYRTNIHHTLKRKPLRLEDLREFIDCYNPTNRHKRKATWHPEKNPEGRWRKFSYEELAARDKTSLDLFWLKDDTVAAALQPAAVGK